MHKVTYNTVQEAPETTRKKKEKKKLENTINKKARQHVAT
jgi:hypothetical protein